MKSNEDICEYYGSLLALAESEVVYEFKADLGAGENEWGYLIKAQTLQLITLAELSLVWESFVKEGYVLERHHKRLDKIVEQMCTNVCRLEVNTKLCGHDMYNYDYLFTEAGISEEDIPKFDEYVGEYISDYGLEPLQKLMFSLLETEDYTKKLILVDQMLNVVHCRGDLASFFIEGGSKSLSQLSGVPEKVG